MQKLINELVKQIHQGNIRIKELELRKIQYENGNTVIYRIFHLLGKEVGISQSAFGCIFLRNCENLRKYGSEKGWLREIDVRNIGDFLKCPDCGSYYFQKSHSSVRCPDCQKIMTKEKVDLSNAKQNRPGPTEYYAEKRIIDLMIHSSKETKIKPDFSTDEYKIHFEWHKYKTFDDFLTAIKENRLSEIFVKQTIIFFAFESPEYTFYLQKYKNTERYLNKFNPSRHIPLPKKFNWMKQSNQKEIAIDLFGYYNPKNLIKGYSKAKLLKSKYPKYEKTLQPVANDYGTDYDTYVKNAIANGILKPEDEKTIARNKKIEEYKQKALLRKITEITKEDETKFRKKIIKKLVDDSQCGMNDLQLEMYLETVIVSKTTDIEEITNNDLSNDGLESENDD